jgi:hypothetical protein
MYYIRVGIKILVKREISISSITVSIVFMLALMAMPHHHHDGLTCITAETREADRAVHDEHACRGEAPGNAHTTTCVSEAEYLAPSSRDESRGKIFAGKDHDHQLISLFPVYYLVAGALNVDARVDSSAIAPGEHISFYTSAEATRFHGLRAPPLPLS